MLASLFALLPYLALISASPIAKRQVAGSVIISGRASDQCLSVEGGAKAVAEGKLTNGTPVITVACAEASLWDIKEGSGSVIVTGTDFALDIGLQPGNHGALKSFPTAPQQTWYLTGDHRIAQTGGDQCLDQGENGVQTYACTPDNSNQVKPPLFRVFWNVGYTGATSTAVLGAPATIATGAYGSDATGVTAPIVISATGGLGGEGATGAISPVVTSSIGDVSGPEATGVVTSSIGDASGPEAAGAVTSSIGNLEGPQATGAATIGDVTGPNATVAYALVADAAATTGSSDQDSNVALELGAPTTTMINPDGADATSIASLVGDFTVLTRYAGSKPTGGDGNTGAGGPTATLNAGGPNTTGDSIGGPATTA